MTNKEAIEILKECWRYSKTYKYTDAEIREAFNLAIKVLEQTMWIPISERLPEKNIEVLATTEFGGITIAERLDNVCWFMHEGAINAHTDDFIAWMPLLESYKGGAE